MDHHELGGDAVSTPDNSETIDRLRRRLLDVATELVEGAGGISVALDITLDTVMKAAGVSRSTMYRAWERKEEFELDLLCTLAGPTWQGTAAFDAETIALARTLVAGRLDLLHTPDGRWRLLRETIRQAANRNYEAVVHSAQWRSYVALTATVVTMSKEANRERVKQSLQDAENVFIDRMAVFYEDMAIIFGLRLRDHDMTYHRLAAVGAAIVEGLGLRQLLASEAVNTPLTIEGPDGPEQWSLAAYGYYNAISGLIELDPDYDFNTALTTYLTKLAERG